MVLLLSSRCAVKITRKLLIAANIPSALNEVCPCNHMSWEPVV